MAGQAGELAGAEQRHCGHLQQQLRRACRRQRQDDDDHAGTE